MKIRDFPQLNTCETRIHMRKTKLGFRFSLFAISSLLMVPCFHHHPSIIFATTNTSKFSFSLFSFAYFSKLLLVSNFHDFIKTFTLHRLCNVHCFASCLSTSMSPLTSILCFYSNRVTSRIRGQNAVSVGNSFALIWSRHISLLEHQTIQYKFK